MSLAEAALNTGADAIAATVTETSLHSASPATAANEISGGSYARIAPSFASASGGSADFSSGLTFNVASGVTVAAYGHWAGSTLINGTETGALSASETYSADGTYTLTSAPIQVQ